MFSEMSLSSESLTSESGSLLQTDFKIVIIFGKSKIRRTQNAQRGCKV